MLNGRFILVGGDADDRLVRRLLLVALLLLFAFAGLALRLWQVQVLQGADHQSRARRQSIRPVRLNPVRGRIYDSAGKPLVENHTSYDLVFYLSQMPQRGRRDTFLERVLETERNLAAYLGRPFSLTRAQVERHLRLRPVLPLTVQRDLTPAEMAAFAEMLPALPGVEVQCRVERRYPQPALLSHVLGYTQLRQPDGKDILEDLPRLYTTPELTGASGLERALNDELSGHPGAKLVEVDPLGYARSELSGNAHPEHGHDLFLTIDRRAQEIAEDVLRGHAGAFVVVDVETGEVLAMASAPSFRLADISPAHLAELFREEEARPLFNRATQGVYTPGSIMKPLLGLAALELCPEEADRSYVCTGAFHIGQRDIHCANQNGHGALKLQEAIQYSCNPFFIRLGLQIGLEEYAPFLRAAGFGEHSGIEIGDAKGDMPSREFARRKWKRNWLAVDSAYLSIGQGAIGVTPLQAAMYCAALANGGVLYRPFLVRRICRQNGEVLQESAPQIRQRLPVSPRSLQRIQEGMVAAVRGFGASAAGMRRAGRPVAAKTGTAEVGSGASRHKNAWVIAYTPCDVPKYALVCLVEHGISGGKSAVPLAAQFLRRWLGEEPAME